MSTRDQNGVKLNQGPHVREHITLSTSLGKLTLSTFRLRKEQLFCKNKTLYELRIDKLWQSGCQSRADTSLLWVRKIIFVEDKSFITVKILYIYKYKYIYNFRCVCLMFLSFFLFFNISLTSALCYVQLFLLVKLYLLNETSPCYCVLSFLQYL